MKESLDHISVELMAQRLAPERAARVIYNSLLFASMDPVGSGYADNLLKDDAAHQWFMFCLTAVARRAPTLGE